MKMEEKHIKTISKKSLSKVTKTEETKTVKVRREDFSNYTGKN